MKRILFAAALLIGMLGTEAASAQNRTIITREQHNGRGGNNGRHDINNRFNRMEARQIQQRQVQLQRERRMALRDGRISPAEQRRLNRLQQQLDFYVFQQTRDRRIR